MTDQKQAVELTPGLVLAATTVDLTHELLPPEGAVPPPIDIGPGSVVRLTEGMQTTWTVHETLRKVYLA